MDKLTHPQSLSWEEREEIKEIFFISVKKLPSPF